MWYQPAEALNKYYHMSNSHECMRVNGEAMQMDAVKKKHFLKQVTRESVLVLQVIQESIPVLQVTHAASEHAKKLKVRMIKSLSP